MAVNAVPNKKSSPLWDYFILVEDNRFVMCMKCELNFCHAGKDAKTYGTTNLLRGWVALQYTVYFTPIFMLSQSLSNSKKEYTLTFDFY